MKLLEEKAHLDPIYVSFHADQHNRMNSVLNILYSGKKKKLK